MPTASTVCYIDFEPLGRRVPCRVGVDLLTIAREAGIGLVALCGGVGTCGRCRVRILEGAVSPLSETERRVLGKDADSGLRLACQTVVLGHAKVYIPPTSLTTRQRTQVEGQGVEFALQPPVKLLEGQLQEPTITDLRADAERLREALVGQGVSAASFDIAVLRGLSDALRRDAWTYRAAVRNQEVVALLGPERPCLGLAVDLGTTKVAAYLVDMLSGATLAAEGMMNPQISYGEDVMARIAYAIGGAEKARQLQQAIVLGLNELALTLCKQVGAHPSDIVEAVVVGNTAMHHLFLGLPVWQLGNAPYLATTSHALDIKARDLGLNLAPGAYVHLLPIIAGFVGADHVAMILATGLYQARATTLALDIGTNTEIALYHEGRLVSCSTASGPAFEGAHITHGMRAAEGAIERVRIENGEVKYETIGGKPPIGICGSGILDAVAQLYRSGILDSRGAMRNSHPRVRESSAGREFVLAPAAETGIGEDIVITRADVGQIQLAKGAIRAGINILLRELGIGAEAVEQFIVAGAFGTYIDIQSAIDIGMFPSLPLERFQQVGNAAGVGARMALLSTPVRKLAIEVAQHAQYLELTNDPRFLEQFTLAMLLGEDGV